MQKILLIFFLSISILFPQSEFIVNTTLDTTQRSPSIAKQSDGSYAVAWASINQVSPNSKSDIYFQRFDADDNKIFDEQLVNSQTEGDQEKPVIAASPNGDYVIAWASYTDVTSIYDIKVKVETFRLPPLLLETTANTTTIHTQSNPAVDVSSTEEIVVVWDSWFQDGGDRGIYGQRFSPNLIKIGEEFQVNQTTEYSQAKPRVKYMSDGKFIVIWESFKQDHQALAGYGMYGRIFNTDGSPATEEFLINTYTVDYQWFGDLDVFDDDSFVVVWCSWEQDGDDGGIYFQRFDKEANKIGDETLANKTTAQYQWLPKVKKLSGKNFAVVWSSWKQDGSREGVYAAFFDENNYRCTFETRVNEYTESFQWEPDFIVTGEEELLVVWSSWKQFSNDYDIVARRIKPAKPQGVINPTGYQHTEGRTSAAFYVHVVDSALLTGHTYEITFDSSAAEKKLLANIRDLYTSVEKVSGFSLDKGYNIFYLTPPFDGAAVEFIPVFDLSLDENNSYFVNSSGTNLIFGIASPTAGQKLIAPIDIALIWGNTDTSTSGQYTAPLDTALNISGQRVVSVPFKAINMTDSDPMSMLVKENAPANKRWDAGEAIVFLTPEEYRKNPTNTHAQLNSNVPAGMIILPSAGDTNFILTKRPLTSNDKFLFTTKKSSIIVSGEMEIVSPHKFELMQNYPNPFNPLTTIKFSLPSAGKVSLKIYNILGQKVSELLNDFLEAGVYRIVFNAVREGKQLASGVYIYSIEFENKKISRKMLFLK